MKRERTELLVTTGFGNIYLTPFSRYEVWVQTFWPVRPLKVGGRKVYASLGFQRQCEEGEWEPNRLELEELPARRPLPPALHARVTAELTRVVSEWAKLNPDLMERAQRRFALERIKEPAFLGDLRNALRKAIAEIATCREYADQDTKGKLMGAILDMRLLETSKLPEVYAHIAKIDKRRLAA